MGLIRPIRRFPYVPNRRSHLDQDCYEAFNIQVEGLRRRFEATSGDHMVIGVSGGLDSTHALIVAAKACDQLGLPRTTILGYTMPGFATGEATKSNAWKLMRALGIEAAEIDIRPAARQMLEDMDHPFAGGEPVYDVTFENVQAGLRTDYLFRLANQHRGFVIGTGDLSELALGWCTYGVGDQMSHYAVNSGVPKTLIQYLIRWVIQTDQFDPATDEVLEAILGTKISPELVPQGEEEELQSTEDKIGPYELHDFFLFHTMRYGLPPSKVAFLAWHAWRDASAGLWPIDFPETERRQYDLQEICKLARGIPLAVLRLQPVQALGAAKRPQGLSRRGTLAAGRLARPLRRHGGTLARRTAAEPSRIAGSVATARSTARGWAGTVASQEWQPDPAIGARASFSVRSSGPLRNARKANMLRVRERLRPLSALISRLHHSVGRCPSSPGRDPFWRPPVKRRTTAMVVPTFPECG